GAGSACGKALGAIPSSTVGYEKLVNWALRHTDEEAFVNELLSGQPEPPTYFAMMKKLNKVPRALLTSVPVLPQFTRADLSQTLQARHHVIDTRSKVLFAAGHIPGTINIQNNKAFSNWAGWVLNYEEPFVLIAHEDQLNELTRKLMRIGLDNVAGYFPNVSDWQEAGGSLATLPQIQQDELSAHLDDASLVVIDVRGASEYQSGHIPGARNIHVGHLVNRLAEIPRNNTVVISCQAGDRSSIAASILQREGFTNITNFPLGYGGWQASGAPVETKASS
ncbi:MAG: MBL fold metallo-hydrolase, partial [Candidatus Kapabacteria bacterium]|nr:MBL fold metallo-hydrolase [Candidatus Kapabacteria bacterium]